MRTTQLLGGALALGGLVSAQTAASTRSCETSGSTTFCWSTYTDSGTGIRVGIALPVVVTSPYDAVISITAPVSIPWAGVAWGGTMVWNPLAVGWANGNSAVISSRWAYGLSLPGAYDGATYTLLKGTATNATHWTVVARCKGCTNWQANDESQVVLDGTGVVELAFARGGSAVQTPSDPNSAFNVHQATGKWYHSLNDARNTNFDTWVAANVLAGQATTTSAPPVSTSKPATMTTVVSTSSKPPVSGNTAIPASCSGAGSPVFQSKLATGWKATKVLGGLTSPRSLQFDLLGNLLMVQSGKGVTYHTMGADGCVTSTKTLISLNSLNHGIALSVDGKTLYVSSMTQVFSYVYDAAAGTVGTRTIVVQGMYNGGSHLTRTLAIAPHKPNLLVVSHGSNDNFDNAAVNAATGRAIVKTFDMSAVPSGGYNYVSGGWVTGYGLRNDVGITFDGNNMLWGVENSGDNFQRTINGASRDIHQNNPAEKLNYLGDVTKAKNEWYGYPTCYAVWQPSDFTDATFKVGDWFVVAPNSTFNDATCKTKATAPSAVFQAHSAPIDLKFDLTYSNLYITYHGSWNRSPTTGFKLVQVAFSKDSTGVYKPTVPLNSNQAAVDIFWNPDVTKCTGNGPSFSSGCFRPAGLAFDKGGRMYMTSDVSSNAELWILGK